MNRVPKSECPCCGKTIDRAAGLNCPDAPREGDVAVCIGCGAVNEFGPGLVLRLIPQKVLAGPDMADARKAQHIIRRRLGFPE